MRATLSIQRDGSVEHGTLRLRVNVPSAFADKARVSTRAQREAYVLGLVNAATLDVWEVMMVKPKRGLGNAGFTAVLRLAD
jgi:hypothetical protein